MSMKIQKIKKLNKAYIGDGIVQIMMPYKEEYLTILSGDGLLYHSSDDSYYNEYLEDQRRYQFPFFSIPVHREKKNGNIITYVNEIYEIAKPYIVLKDGKIIQDSVFCISKDLKEYVQVQRVLTPKLFSMSKNVNFNEIDKHIHYINSIDEGKKYIFSNGGVLSDEIDYRNINENETNNGESKIMITINEGLINSIKGIKIDKNNNNFNIMVFDFPMVNISQKKLKTIGKYASPALEPKIKKRFNSGVSREQIIRAKTMARLKN